MVQSQEFLLSFKWATLVFGHRLLVLPSMTELWDGGICIIRGVSNFSVCSKDQLVFLKFSLFVFCFFLWWFFLYFFFLLLYWLLCKSLLNRKKQQFLAWKRLILPRWVAPSCYTVLHSVLITALARSHLSHQLGILFVEVAIYFALLHEVSLNPKRCYRDI